MFTRFSTVAGSRGSPDTPRDVRGFAVKFYTDEGVWDMVGNDMPVFFIQDAIKFPDLIHAVKPEPDNEIPQAQSAHDTFYDFASLMPEIAHMLMWVMSDRALPRTFGNMQGFGIHTYRWINAQGKSTFVKFHFKPKAGLASMVWDESHKLTGADPDFQRRHMWDSIEMGDYPEWEFGVQLVPEADEHKFDFDILDATKIIPEELVPVTPVGKLVLNRNPENYFAETEQVAFSPGHVVPGIDFSNDPLLQGRLFSYLDTQLKRVGPNFAQLPINRPTCPMHNNERDAESTQVIPKGKVVLLPQRAGERLPDARRGDQATPALHSYAERIDGNKIRGRSPSFNDHFSAGDDVLQLRGRLGAAAHHRGPQLRAEPVQGGRRQAADAGQPADQHQPQAGPRRGREHRHDRQGEAGRAVPAGHEGVAGAEHGQAAAGHQRPQGRDPGRARV